MQCGAHLLTVLLISCRLQLTVWFNSANVMFNSSGCNFVFSCEKEIEYIFTKLWVHSVIVYHVRNKLNLAVVNT